jgi:hypothetical protein
MKAQHGTRAMYVSGCHCEKCSMANREYQRKRMADLYVPAKDGMPHGYRRADGSIRYAR